MSTTDMSTTATRRNGKVEVTLPDGRTVSLGGKRAQRATVALVAYLPGDETWQGWRVLGLRSDGLAAQTEADRRVTDQGWERVLVVPVR